MVVDHVRWYLVEALMGSCVAVVCKSLVSMAAMTDAFPTALLAREERNHLKEVGL